MRTNIKLIGAVAVTGVSVTNVEYVVNETDASKLSSIVFSETQDVSTGHTATLTLGKGTTATVFTRSDCATITAPGTEPAAPGTITCATTANVADVDSVALATTP